MEITDDKLEADWYFVYAICRKELVEEAQSLGYGERQGFILRYPITGAEIVVRPDGLRVLMIPMSIGGMEAVTSVEISKPTDGKFLGNDIKGDADVNNLTENMEDSTSN